MWYNFFTLCTLLKDSQHIPSQFFFSFQMVLISLLHFHILHPVHNFSCFLWSFAVLFHLLWNEDRLDSLSWIQDSKSGRFMVCTRLQQCFLPYYNIFLPLKAKGSLQGMVAMSLESPYQVLMITQSRVSFEYRWIFFSKVIALFLFMWKCASTFWHPVGFPDVFHNYITGVSFSPCEDILRSLQTRRFH